TLEVSPTLGGACPPRRESALNNALISVILCPIRRMFLDIKKAWIVLLSVPRTKALALPNPDEQTTLEPTPI
ncbi:MAG: hypothetical protein SPE11_08145, partial [Parabacteroides sp.]|nr:hypothetical protein [Parabacteroides sp.]